MMQKRDYETVKSSIEREIKGVVSDNKDDWIFMIQQGQMNL